ncbi:hypothetical protein D9615_009980 [Tricholomella constricta]|uniref:Uncharacterized protein n=1 Tax=Tricholomella constricta TaxID=117010 RepID=A0A8H5GR00_9AGAR|nr:hypothetical protein D9615_009980 [Tricholomella constricta]
MAAGEDGPHNGHLGTTWEIVVITIFVVLVIVILGTVVFQTRRKHRRRREEALDAELGRRQGELEAEKGDSIVDGASLSVPEPTADPARHPKSSRSKASTPTSSYHDRERPSKKPPAPRYYWDHR